MQKQIKRSKNIFLASFLILFLSCSKNDDIKVENVLDREGSHSEANRNEKTDAAGKNETSETSKVSKISTVEASAKVGKNVVLIGYVADVVIREKVAYLNFDNKYPKHTFTGVIFASDHNKFDDIKVYKNKQVELTGLISEYRGKPQIIIKSPDQIKIVK